MKFWFSWWQLIALDMMRYNFLRSKDFSQIIRKIFPKIEKEKGQLFWLWFSCVNRKTSCYILKISNLPQNASSIIVLLKKWFFLPNIRSISKKVVEFKNNFALLNVSSLVCRAEAKGWVSRESCSSFWREANNISVPETVKMKDLNLIEDIVF